MTTRVMEHNSNAAQWREARWKPPIAAVLQGVEARKHNLECSRLRANAPFFWPRSTGSSLDDDDDDDQHPPSYGLYDRPSRAVDRFFNVSFGSQFQPGLLITDDAGCSSGASGDGFVEERGSARHCFNGGGGFCPGFCPGFCHYPAQDLLSDNMTTPPPFFSGGYDELDDAWDTQRTSSQDRYFTCPGGREPHQSTFRLRDHQSTFFTRQVTSPPLGDIIRPADEPGIKSGFLLEDESPPPNSAKMISAPKQYLAAAMSGATWDREILANANSLDQMLLSEAAHAEVGMPLRVPPQAAPQSAPQALSQAPSQAPPQAPPYGSSACVGQRQDSAAAAGEDSEDEELRLLLTAAAVRLLMETDDPADDDDALLRTENPRWTSQQQPEEHLSGSHQRRAFGEQSSQSSSMPHPRVPPKKSGKEQRLSLSKADGALQAARQQEESPCCSTTTGVSLGASRLSVCSSLPEGRPPGPGEAFERGALAEGGEIDKLEGGEIDKLEGGEIDKLERKEIGKLEGKEIGKLEGKEIGQLDGGEIGQLEGGEPLAWGTPRPPPCGGDGFAAAWGLTPEKVVAPYGRGAAEEIRDETSSTAPTANGCTDNLQQWPPRKVKPPVDEKVRPPTSPPSAVASRLSWPSIERATRCGGAEAPRYFFEGEAPRYGGEACYGARSTQAPLACCYARHEERSSSVRRFFCDPDMGGRRSVPQVLAHPEEFRNPSSFLKVYGDPLCADKKSNKRGQQNSGIIARGHCGNWSCSHCDNVNYPRRFRCNKCNEPRDAKGDAVVAEYAAFVYLHHLKTYRKLFGGVKAGRPQRHTTFDAADYFTFTTKRSKEEENDNIACNLAGPNNTESICTTPPPSLFFARSRSSNNRGIVIKGDDDGNKHIYAAAREGNGNMEVHADAGRRKRGVKATSQQPNEGGRLGSGNSSSSSSNNGGSGIGGDLSGIGGDPNSSSNIIVINKRRNKEDLSEVINSRCREGMQGGRPSSLRACLTDTTQQQWRPKEGRQFLLSHENDMQQQPRRRRSSSEEDVVLPHPHNRKCTSGNFAAL